MNPTDTPIPATSSFIVRHGAMRFLGEFSAATHAAGAAPGFVFARRGDTVIVRTDRGTEIGEVLCPATPKAVAAIAAETGDRLRLYPDPASTRLRQAIANLHGVEIGEIFVGLMTPLGLSFARYHQRNVHGGCAAAIGVRDIGHHVGYMGYLQGHVYLNVSYTAYLLSQCLPTRDQAISPHDSPARRSTSARTRTRTASARAARTS